MKRSAWLLKASLCIIGLVLCTFPATKVQAVPPLELTRDIIYNDDPDLLDVHHDISFVLPISAAQISPSDWILIDFHDFSNVIPPSEISGGYGNPQITKVGNTVRITNIAVLPGNAVKIFGVIAKNPPQGTATKITISIANDPEGNLIRNQSTILASPDGGLISITATVETITSSVSISGHTSPSAFVTLSENGTVRGTASSDGDGFFLFPISGLNPGEHNFRIFSTDTNNRSTAQAVVQLFLLPGTLTTASGILLSPAISLSVDQIAPGDPITVSGSAKPSSQINLFIESPLRSYSITSNSNGDWSYTIPASETANFLPGEYRAYSNVQDNIGNQSLTSPTLTFEVTSSDTDENPPPDCDISQGDLNCDGSTNLIDFSILLFHWRTNHKVADINSDGTVSLVDFSIMMFYFRR